jgi:flagellar M-ring protein FliF
VEARERLQKLIATLPVAHRVVIATALVALVMLAVVFGRWVTAPSYTVLYSGLDDAAVAGVITELDSAGVPYKLEGGGSRVLVPRDQLYTTRASLASAGLGGATTPPGYELLDDQGLSVSDFRQRVDYKRALEGELSKTLSAMDGIRAATVHLVVPEKELFADRQEPVTASVLLDTLRPLNAGEVETVTFLTTSSVEGLDMGGVTVADVKGNVLHAPGEAGGPSTTTNRNMRQTREFEQALAEDVTKLLSRVAGGPASVVVRAALNFDEQQTERESYDPDSGVVLKEQVSGEQYEGTMPMQGGAVGVDGGPVEGTEASESSYQKEDAVREFGVDRVSERIISAPGKVERLSVAIVTDDGSRTGVQVPRAVEIEELVTAALGLDEERGDTLAVSLVSFPRPEEPEVAGEGEGLIDLVTQIIAVLVLLVVSIALFLMTRRRKGSEVEWVQPTALELPEQPTAELPSPTQEPAKEPALVGGGLQAEVTELVQRQPEEIATLLRSWLADRRG